MINIRPAAPIALLVAAALLPSGCRRGEIQPERYLQGTVELDERVLGFEVAGRVNRLEVHRGQEVKANQLLANLDDELARTEHDARAADTEAAQAQKKLVDAGNRPAQIREAEARLRASKANEEQVRQNYEREKALLAKEATPKATVDDLEAQYKAARASRQAVEQELTLMREGSRPQEKENADARADAAKKNEALSAEKITKYELRAPIDGLVLDTHVDPGVVVAPATPIVTLADVKRPYVDVFVPVADLGPIQPGSKATVRVDASVAPRAAHVEWISQTTEFTPRFLFSPRERPNLVVRVRVRIDEAAPYLHAGVPAFCSIEGVEVARSN